MSEEKEYYCEHCKKKFDEDEIDFDAIENEPLCPVCGEYLDEI